MAHHHFMKIVEDAKHRTICRSPEVRRNRTRGTASTPQFPLLGVITRHRHVPLPSARPLAAFTECARPAGARSRRRQKNMKSTTYDANNTKTVAILGNQKRVKGERGGVRGGGTLSHLAVVRNPGWKGGRGSLGLNQLGGSHRRHGLEARRLLAGHGVSVDVVEGLRPPRHGRLREEREEMRMRGMVRRKNAKVGEHQSASCGWIAEIMGRRMARRAVYRAGVSGGHRYGENVDGYVRACRMTRPRARSRVSRPRYRPTRRKFRTLPASLRIAGQAFFFFIVCPKRD